MNRRSLFNFFTLDVQYKAPLISQFHWIQVCKSHVHVFDIYFQLKASLMSAYTTP